MLSVSLILCTHTNAHTHSHSCWALSSLSLSFPLSNAPQSCHNDDFFPFLFFPKGILLVHFQEPFIFFTVSHNINRNTNDVSTFATCNLESASWLLCTCLCVCAYFCFVSFSSVLSANWPQRWKNIGHVNKTKHTHIYMYIIFFNEDERREHVLMFTIMIWYRHIALNSKILLSHRYEYAVTDLRVVFGSFAFTFYFFFVFNLLLKIKAKCSKCFHKVIAMDGLEFSEM